GYADAVAQSGEALLAIINDILDFSKIEAGKLALQERPFNLINTVEQACELLAARAVERDIAIGATFTPEVPEFVYGDAGRLRQIILNLGGNSIKFTDKGGVMIAVSVTFESEGGVVLLFEVKDTGIGIEAALQEKLFEEFSQVDSGSTRRYGGTGLGLAISQRIVQRMKGQIGVESTPNEGSTFWFMIDLALDPAATDSALDPTSLAGLNVLLCDGNATSREIIRRSLAALGARVRDFSTAGETRAALDQAAARGETIDAALIDGILPEATITELGAALRQSPAGRDCRLVLLLQVDQHTRLKPYRDNGFEFFLVRPIRRRTLVQVLTGVHGEEGEWLDPRLPPAVAEQGPEAEQAPARVLLAEDNRINQMLVEALLSRSGLVAECVENGRQAVEAVQQGNYSLVLMDINMPLVDGLQATREIRALKDGKSSIPIIAMTASAMDEDRQRCAAAGMNGYISKPIEEEELLGLIAQWTDTSKQNSKAS
ncbi:MAG: response regulator, partial [Rhodospirillaceae bacterium]|nr:response regulator [Rhodospirillaceae bacterium]